MTTKMSHVYICDQCNTEVLVTERSWDSPPGWFYAGASGQGEDAVEKDFCCGQCLALWAASLEVEPSPVEGPAVAATPDSASPEAV